MSIIAFTPKDDIRHPWHELREGFTYARQHARIAPVLLLDVAIALFGINVIAVFVCPRFADVQLNSPKIGFAAVSATLGVGAIFAGLLSVRLSRRFGRGTVIFLYDHRHPSGDDRVLHFSTSVPVAAFLMGVLGFGFATFFVTSNALIQNAVEDQFRGRVMALFMLALWGFPLMTTLAFGIVAELLNTSNTFAISAAILLMIALWVRIKMPYVAPLPTPPEHAPPATVA